MNLKHRIWPVFMFLWASVIMVLSVIPGADLPSLSIWEPDKVMHATVYAILTICTFQSLPALKKGLYGRKRKIAAFLLCISYGFFIELIQLLLPTRSFDLLDEFANMIGCSLALIILSLFPKKESSASGV